MKYTGSLTLLARIPKYKFFCQGVPNFWGLMAGKFRKTAKTGKSIVLQIRDW